MGKLENFEARNNHGGGELVPAMVNGLSFGRLTPRKADRGLKRAVACRFIRRSPLDGGGFFVPENQGEGGFFLLVTP
jgi:hypothetical protein